MWRVNMWRTLYHLAGCAGRVSCTKNFQTYQWSLYKYLGFVFAMGDLLVTPPYQAAPQLHRMLSRTARTPSSIVRVASSRILLTQEIRALSFTTIRSFTTSFKSLSKENKVNTEFHERFEGSGPEKSYKSSRDKSGSSGKRFDKGQSNRFQSDNEKSSNANTKSHGKSDKNSYLSKPKKTNQGRYDKSKFKKSHSKPEVVETYFKPVSSKYTFKKKHSEENRENMVRKAPEQQQDYSSEDVSMRVLTETLQQERYNKIISSYPKTSPSSSSPSSPVDFDNAVIKKGTARLDPKEGEIVLSGSISNKNTFTYTPLVDRNSPSDKIPKLRPDLEKVLTSPGVHFYEDPRTKYRNFETCHIPNIDEIKVERLPLFQSASKHKPLHETASLKHNSTDGKYSFASSTSSMTGLLKDFHFLLSSHRPLNISSLSQQMNSKTAGYADSAMFPTTVLVKQTDGFPNVYSISSEQLSPSESSLSIMGHVFEILLTSDDETLKTYLKSHNTDEELVEPQNEYHYTKIGNFVIRSQLDTYSDKLPGTGTFDLKARAVCAIRNDLRHSEFFPTNYSIVKRTGKYESFEKEVFDLARTTMVKYVFQAKLGNMDGIFVAFHNLNKIFGFQYFPLAELEDIIHGFDNYDGADTSRVPDSLDVVSPRPTEDQLRDIATNIPSHYLNHREMISSKIADFELMTSFEILSKLTNHILKIDDKTPFRLLTTFYPGKFQKPVLDVLVTFIDPSLMSEYEQSCKSASDISKTMILEQQERVQSSLQKLGDTSNVEEKELVLSELLQQNQKNSKPLYMNAEKMNRRLWYSAVRKERAHVFRITINNKFNGESITTRHPTPPDEFLDPNSDFKWDVDYEIQEIKDPEIREGCFQRYMRKVTDVTHGIMNDDIYNDSDEPFDDEALDDETLYSANLASLRQKTLRAFSARGKIRNTMAETHLGRQ